MMNMKEKFIMAGVIFLTLLSSSFYLYLLRGNAPMDKVKLCVGDTIGFSVILNNSMNYFPSEGIDLSVATVSTNNAVIEQLIRGECDISMTMETPIVYHGFSKKNFKIIGTLGTSSNLIRIVAREDRGINKWSDLKNKSLATQKCINMQLCLDIFLRKNGIGGNDIRYVYMSADKLPGALDRGEVDALAIYDTVALKAEKLMRDKVIVLEEPGMYMCSITLAATDSFIENRPETVKRVLSSFMKALKSSDASKIDIGSTAKWAGASVKDVEDVWRSYRWKISLDQSLLLKLEEEALWMMRNSIIKEKELPNYLNYIYFDGLMSVDPDAVTIIR